MNSILVSTLKTNHDVTMQFVVLGWLLSFDSSGRHPSKQL